MATKTRTKRRNPNDATVARNIRPLWRDLRALTQRVLRLERELARLDRALRG